LLFTESSIVMAEQSSRDVVDQTLSGGEPSPSDVLASTNDKLSAGGDAGKTEHIAMNTATSNNSTLNDQHNHETKNTLDQRGERAGGDKDIGGPISVRSDLACAPQKFPLIWAQENSKQGAGLVATRVLELNGLASASDGGDDTASQGGSESDASRTESRNTTHSGSIKKPGSFKPVSFAKQKFSVPKVPGAAAPPKAPEKGMLFVQRFVIVGADLYSSFNFHNTAWYPTAQLPPALGCEDYTGNA
jgi:large subunit ribosomal protein L30